MIKDIFFPTAIKNYYIFGQKIIGIDIRKTRVVGTQIYVQGKKIIIENIVEEKTFLNENLEKYIQDVFSKLEKANEIKAALPNSLAIFKKLTLPFIDQKKIEMVLPFEIESSLPFKLHNSVLNFIIVNQDKTKKNSSIVAAITQLKHVEYLKNLIDESKNKLTNLSIEIISIYSLLRENNALENVNILIDLSYANTTIAIIENENLIDIRTINKGLSSLIQSVSKKEHLTLGEALQQLERSGAQKFQNEIDEFIENISNEILFTISAFKDIKINKALIVNSDIDLNISRELESKLKINTIVFDPNSIINKNIQKKEHVNLNKEFLSSISIAIPTIISSNFNLLKHEVGNKKLLKAQLITSVILSFLIVGALILFSYIRIKQLNNELEKSKKELTSVIKSTFDITDSSLLKTPAKLVEHIKNKVNEAESLWFSFSKKTRFSFLKYLQELSAIINTSKIGLKLKKLSLSEGSIDMIGSVPDFPSLKELEESLNNSKLFSKITKPQETDFNITLTFKKNGEI
jgi:Tfp pilus assembly PilM family ATPase